MPASPFSKALFLLSCLPPPLPLSPCPGSLTICAVHPHGSSPLSPGLCSLITLPGGTSQATEPRPSSALRPWTSLAHFRFEHFLPKDLQGFPSLIWAFCQGKLYRREDSKSPPVFPTPRMPALNTYSFTKWVKYCWRKWINDTFVLFLQNLSQQDNDYIPLLSRTL